MPAEEQKRIIKVIKIKWKSYEIYFFVCGIILFAVWHFGVGGRVRQNRRGAELEGH